MKLTIEETKMFIRIGFGRKSDFKACYWRRAEKIMNFLCNNTQDIFPCDYGRGKGKYSTKLNLSDENITRWATLYVDSMN